MKGLEISRRYFEAYGRDMLEKEFPEYLPRIAAGLAGPGSDCFGFDDEISLDHDSGAGFCLWLSDEDYRNIGFKLARAYAALPDEIDGVKKMNVPPYGKNHFGVMKISDFFLPLTGCPGAPETDEQWLFTPESSLAAAVNGEVFTDISGVFSEIRRKIKQDMPRDVRLKKISSRAIAMAQSGQYNFPRCLEHGEAGAAALAKAEFAKNAVSLIYILNGEFAPFYKWAFRGAKNLPLFSGIACRLEQLLISGTVKEQSAEIEAICEVFADYFRENALSSAAGSFLEPHAYEIREKIKSAQIRSMHIMEG